MADDTATNGTAAWMSDVQRALALVLVGTFAFALVLLTIRLVIWGDPPTLIDLVKTLISALINVVMLVLGYFYGSSKAKEQSDNSQQKIVEKLTSTQPPGPPGPVAPAPAPTIVVAWWSVLTPGEQAAITAAVPGDPRVAAFAAAAQSGKAAVVDLDYLVAKGLLTPERAAIIGTT